MLRSRSRVALFVLILSAGCLACSFNYGDTSDDADLALPDMVLQNFEFVRVRNNAVQAKLQGDLAERYEKKQSMTIDQLRFAQYAQADPTAKAVGIAGAARLDLASGDVAFSDGVQIVVAGEGLTIETQQLSWYDKERILIAPDDIPVLIKKEDGSILSGKGFGADARRRSWEFANSFTAQYIDEEKAPPVESVAPAPGVSTSEQAAGAVSAVPTAPVAAVAAPPQLPRPAPPDGAPQHLQAVPLDAPPGQGAEPSPSDKTKPATGGIP